MISYDNNFSKNWRSEGGYTLVEALVVLAIVAMISVFLTSVLRDGGRLLDISSGASARLDALAGARDLLRRLLAEDYPAAIVVKDTAGRPVFNGQSDRLTFSAPLPVPFGKGGYYRISLFSANDDLMIAWEPERGQTEASVRDISGETHILLRSVHQLHLRYFGSIDQGNVGWHTEWHDQERTPLLIGLAIQLADNRAPPWPELVVSAHIDVNSHCVYDLLTARCQGH